MKTVCQIGMYCLLFLCLGSTGFTQKTYPVKVNKKWGLMDSTGALKIAPNYDAIGAFEEGMAVVSLNHRYGVVNEKGEMVVPVEFNMIQTTPQNSAIYMLNSGGHLFNGICRGGKWGFYNRDSETLLAPAYDELGDFNQLFVVVKNKGKSGLVNARGIELVPCKYDFISLDNAGQNAYIPFRTEKGMGLADFSGKTLLPARFQDIQMREAGRFAIQLKNKWGIANATGEVLIEPQYLDLTTASNGGYFYQVEGNLWGMVDSAGKEIIPARYTSLAAAPGSGIKVEQSGKFGFFTETGNPWILPQYEEVIGLNGAYAVALQNEKAGLFNLEGTLILPHQYTNISLASPNRFICTTDTGTFLFDQTGTPLFAGPLDSILSFDYQVAIVIHKGKYGLLHTNGTFVKEPEFDRIDRFQTVCDLFTNGKKETIYLTESGEITRRRQLKIVRGAGPKASVGTLWDEGYPLQGVEKVGWYWEKKQKAYGLSLLSKDLRREIRSLKPSYRRVEVIPGTDLTYVATGTNNPRTGINYTYGLVNHKLCKEVVPPTFTQIRITDYAEHKVAKATIKGGRHILIRVDGKLLSNLEVSYVGTFSEGFMPVCKGGKRRWSKDNAAVALESRVVKGWYDLEAYSEYLSVEGGKWGLVNAEGNWVVSPKYDFIGSFKGGLAPVKDGGKWGVIDTNFATLVEPVYDFAAILQVQEGFFVKTELSSPSFGYISRTGEMELVAKYEDAGPFSEGFAAAKQGGKWGYIDRSGDWVIEPQFREAGEFHEGLARIRPDGKERGWMIIDTTGSLVFQKRFVRMRDYHDGCAAVQVNGRWGFINREGNWVIKPHFSRVQDFMEERSIVTTSGRMGVVDKEGKWVIPNRYYKIMPFSEGVTVVRSKAGFGLIDREGNKLTRAKYHRLGNFHNGYAYFKSGYKFGYLNLEGKEVILGKFAMVRDFEGGLAPVRIGGEWGYIDTTGKMVIEPIFSDAKPFSEGFAAVRLNGQWGFIDKHGEQSVSCKYKRVQPFHAGRAAVQNKVGEWGYLNENLQEVITPQFQKTQAFEAGMAQVKKEGKWGYINELGGPITLAKFKEIKPFSEGLAPVRIDLHAGLFDEKGTPLLDNGYDTIREYHGLLQIEASGKIGYLDAGGKWIWNLSD